MESIVKVAGGEYGTYYLTDQGNLYTYLWSQAILKVIPTLVVRVKVANAAGGLHGGSCVDITGNVWTFGDNTYGERGNGTLGGDGSSFQILKDNTGNAFTGIAETVGWYFSNVARKIDGTIWFWGQDYLNIFGGNILTPTPLQMPVGVSISKIIAQLPLLALDTTGGVWEWRYGNKTPVKVSLPGQATDIAGCANGASFAVVNGQIYGWASASQWGIPTSPINMTSQWRVPAAIATGPGSIVGNDNTLHYIDVHGNLWGVGDNAMGEVGNGDAINYSVITPPNGLYAWNWSRYQKMVRTPIQVSSGMKQICTQNSDVFYVYAQDINGNWYSWGRNKGFVLGNGVGLEGDLASTYPNLADVLKPTLVTPLTTPIVDIANLAAGEILYAKNTGFGSTTTTTSTTKATTTTSTTSTTTSTTSSTTTTTTTKHWPYITLYNDMLWDYGPAK